MQRFRQHLLVPRQSIRCHVYPAGVSLHLMAGPPHSSAPSCSCGQQTARNPRNKSQLRAAFSSGNNTSCLGKKNTASSPVQPAISKHFARRPIQGLVSTQHGSTLPVYSSTTYRDEGALSEITIADYLCEQLPHSSTADLRAGSAQTQLVTSSAPNVHKKVLLVLSFTSIARVLRIVLTPVTCTAAWQLCSML